MEPLLFLKIYMAIGGIFYNLKPLLKTMLYEPKAAWLQVPPISDRLFKLFRQLANKQPNVKDLLQIRFWK